MESSLRHEKTFELTFSFNRQSAHDILAYDTVIFLFLQIDHASVEMFGCVILSLSLCTKFMPYSLYV